MWKWFLGLAVLAGVGYGGYDYYRMGLYSAPELKDGDFLLSFNNGFRAVMRGIEDERKYRNGPNDSDDKRYRRYFGIPARDVPRWYEETWSNCRMPSEEELEYFLANDKGPGSRLDAVCEIDADGDVFIRGWVMSVPHIE